MMIRAVDQVVFGRKFKKKIVKSPKNRPVVILLLHNNHCKKMKSRKNQLQQAIVGVAKLATLGANVGSTLWPIIKPLIAS
jgi:hypothetical protein